MVGVTARALSTLQISKHPHGGCDRILQPAYGHEPDADLQSVPSPCRDPAARDSLRREARNSPVQVGCGRAELYDAGTRGDAGQMADGPSNDEVASIENAADEGSAASGCRPFLCGVE